MVTHLSSASFKEWPEFKALCGRVWVMGTSGHGPRGVFKAVVVDKASPITAGISDFQQDDELYAKLQGDAPIRVLLQAESDWSKKTEPLAFTLDYGKGRVFHHTFGHDAKALSTPEVQKLIVQGTAWAAGDEPAGRRAGRPSSAVEMRQPEPNVFGNKATDARHFTNFSLRQATGDPTASIDGDLQAVVNLMNPMYFIGQNNRGLAGHWWIRMGTSDNHTSLTVIRQPRGEPGEPEQGRECLVVLGRRARRR